jgi:pimeloyl-ACP methyl ester carboxylesterase
VARRYYGRLGKTDNCQIAVSLSLASARGSVPLAYRLYLPQEWTEDRQRCRAAGVPESVQFQTKGQIARDHIAAGRARAWFATPAPADTRGTADVHYRHHRHGVTGMRRSELSRRATVTLIGIVVCVFQAIGTPSRASARDRAIEITNDRGGVRLAGTLSVPNGEGPLPAVLLVAAAGPEGRDEEVAGHHVFTVLANDLVGRGIAVLRYDKRGVGESTGSRADASFDDLVSDAQAEFRFLKTVAQVSRGRIGVIGHSEGGSIASAVAAMFSDVAFVVAIAGSRLSGEVRVTEGQVYMARESGASTLQQEAVRRLCSRIFRTVARTSDDAAADTRISALIDQAASANRVSTEQIATMRQLLTAAFVRRELNDDPIV